MRSGWGSGKLRFGAVMAAGAILVVACNGGDDAGTTDTPPAADDTSTDDRAGEGLTRTQQLEMTPPLVLDLDGEDRCDRLAYPCSWSDVPVDDFDRSHQLSIELNEIAQSAGDPIVGTDAAVARLDEVPDLAELIVDREGYTGLMFRLEGMPEMYMYTAWAGPASEDRELDLTTLDLGALVDDLDSATTQPSGFRGVVVPQAYHPTGGPIVPKKALVLDPYSTRETACPEGAPRGATCMMGSDNRLEGSLIHAILDAHDQISSTYVSGISDTSQEGSWDPILGPPLSDFDLVHLASHGNSGCANAGPGWVIPLDLDYLIGDEPPEIPDHCFSSSALVPYDRSRYDSLPAEERVVPDGLSLSGNTWVVRDYYWVDKIKPTAIVYMSHCTSADGSFFRSGRYGSFVGWHSYARITTAAEAGITFWTLMVTEGLEFEQAIEQLADRDLTSTVVLDRNNGGVTRAVMGSGGRNQRARDVIKVRIDGSDPNGQVLKVNGIPGDDEPETFPTSAQELAFDLEGVRRGSEASVRFELYLDGEKVEMVTELRLQEHGEKIKEGKDWDVWRLKVPADAFRYRRTDAADFEPDRQFNLEVRAYEEADEYTAHGGVIRLGADLESTAPLAIFTQLEDAVAGVAEVEGNDLRINFNTYETNVTGYMLVTIDGAGGGGFWEMDLEGTYNHQTGNMEGTFDATALGIAAGFLAGEQAGGDWQATANLDTQSVTGTLTVNGQSQSYNGTIVRPGTPAPT